MTRLNPVPKGNGKWYTVLLVGGPSDVYRKLRDKLADTRAMHVKYHWEYKKHAAHEHIPKDVDAVIIIKDMIDIGLSLETVKMSKKQSVIFIRTQSEWAVMASTLRVYDITSDHTLGDAIRAFDSLTTFEQQKILYPEMMKEEKTLPVVQVTAGLLPKDFNAKDWSLGMLVEMLKAKAREQQLTVVYTDVNKGGFEAL